MKKFLPFLLLLPLIYGCAKTDPKDVIVYIGKKPVTKSSNEAFDKVNRMYPTDPGVFFPGFRSKMTHLVEAELIYSKVPAAFRDSLKNSGDWELKQLYYPAQLFMMEYLAVNLGVSESEISGYYEANKDSFKVTVTNDSTKKDSSFVQPLSEVKDMIIGKLFMKTNAPDSAFLTRFDSLSEPAYIQEQWLSHVKQNLPTFFMKKIYAEVNGKKYPDSLSDIYGKDKYITPADMDHILAWIPEVRRGQYDSPDGKRELVEWLVRWKMFSAYASKKRLQDPKALRDVMLWAWKLNVAYAYVNAHLAPQCEKSTAIDSSMLLFALYDDNGYSPVSYSDNGFSTKLSTEQRDQTLMNLDGIIMGYRKGTTITFPQQDWNDIKNQKPDSLLKQADTYRDSGKTNEAKDIYQTLSKEFAFTTEGQNALIELAKIQTEQQLYSQAIGNYRKHLLISKDSDKRCNTFFMIGFIYDEYLEQPTHAEANYKWVLKNAPSCELADDAEFMMLHLNEPMSSVEELRDEATRQGRKVDQSEVTEVPADSLKK